MVPAAPQEADLPRVFGRASQQVKTEASEEAPEMFRSRVETTGGEGAALEALKKAHKEGRRKLAGSKKLASSKKL
jgi:hypothetical protein